MERFDKKNKAKYDYPKHLKKILIEVIVHCLTAATGEKVEAICLQET